MLQPGTEPTIAELSAEGRVGVSLPRCDVPEAPLEELIPKEQIRTDLPLPEVSEPDVVRHFTRLSQRNVGIDTHFYPLGSCTMKYNPKVNEEIASWRAFSGLHPYQPEETVQGALRILQSLERFLCEIGGMDAASLQPAAGALGEFTGLLIIRAYHADRGESHRNLVLVPDSSHGTNPATAARCGYQVVKVASDERGRVDLGDLERHLSDHVAALMMTNPNTLGVFEDQIQEVCELAHSRGVQVYCDGANMNAVLGICRPGDMGFDVMHFNLHKTFSTPHGGGGPGSGPVAVKSHLEPYLPVPRLREEGGILRWNYDYPKSIGRMHPFYGNFAVALRAYCYIRQLGPEGLRSVSEDAVLNANYLLKLLVDGGADKGLELPYPAPCMHEFVLSAAEHKKATGVRTADIAKRLLDYGFHPPTVYFPLIVEEALMIEPTETVSKETLDAFAQALLAILDEDPDVVKNSPHTAPVSRVDEVKAARELNLRW